MHASLLVAASLILATGAFAQERTAGQAYDSQVNWAALRSQIDLVSTQNKVLAAMLDKFTACSNKKAIYAPAQPGHDADGCVKPASAPTIDYAQCQQLNWKSFYGYCPNNMVLAGAVTRNSDSGEWNSFYCCPFTQ